MLLLTCLACMRDDDYSGFESTHGYGPMGGARMRWLTLRSRAGLCILEYLTVSYSILQYLWTTPSALTCSPFSPLCGIYAQKVYRCVEIFL